MYKSFEGITKVKMTKKPRRDHNRSVLQRTAKEMTIDNRSPKLNNDLSPLRQHHINLRSGNRSEMKHHPKIQSLHQISSHNGNLNLINL